MATRFFRKRSILAKIESSYATDPTPTGAANAIQARNVAFTPLDLDYEDRDVVRPYLGHREQIVVTGKARLSFETEIAGSGTAGTAPAWGPLARACAVGQTTLGTAHANTAPAGGASTITLHSSGSAVDEAYRGLRIRITAGTGSGQARICSTYNGTTKVLTVSEAWTTPPDATSEYSIDAQVGYLPVSASFESIAIYFNLDGKRHILLGVRGTMGIKLNARAIPMLMFDFTGLVGTITDTALPTDVFTAWTKPLAVNNANTSGFTLHGFAGKLYGVEVAIANEVEYRNLVGQEDVIIGDRKPAGTLTIDDPTLAEKNYFTTVTGVTTGALNVLHGTAAGNQFHLHAPTVQLTAPGYDNRQGVVALRMATRFTPNLGNDEVAFQAL